MKNGTGTENVSTRILTSQFAWGGGGLDNIPEKF